MNTKLIIVTHEDIGLAMLKVAKNTLGHLPFAVQAVSVPTQAEPEAIISQLQIEINKVATEQGILILTDIYGATPCNISQHLKHGNELRVVAGLNLPMLLRTLQYATEIQLTELVTKAIEGGKEGVRACQVNHDNLR